MGIRARERELRVHHTPYRHDIFNFIHVNIVDGFGIVLPWCACLVLDFLSLYLSGFAREAVEWWCECMRFTSHSGPLVRLVAALCVCVCTSVCVCNKCCRPYFSIHWYFFWYLLRWFLLERLRGELSAVGIGFCAVHWYYKVANRSTSIWSLSCRCTFG